MVQSGNKTYLELKIYILSFDLNIHIIHSKKWVSRVTISLVHLKSNKNV